jgi:large subunit ribosomal protein L4
MAELLTRLGLADKRTLLVIDKADANVVKSCRNIPNLHTTLANQIHAYDLMNCDMLLVTADGLDRMKEVFVR